MNPSVADICFTPTVSEIVLKVAEKPPVVLAVIVDGFVVFKFPSKLMVMFELGTKFEPLTVTAVPSGPL